MVNRQRLSYFYHIILFECSFILYKEKEDNKLLFYKSFTLRIFNVNLLEKKNLNNNNGQGHKINQKQLLQVQRLPPSDSPLKPLSCRGTACGLPSKRVDNRKEVITGAPLTYHTPTLSLSRPLHARPHHNHHPGNHNKNTHKDRCQ